MYTMGCNATNLPYMFKNKDSFLHVWYSKLVKIDGIYQGRVIKLIRNALYIYIYLYVIRIKKFQLLGHHRTVNTIDEWSIYITYLPYLPGINSCNCLPTKYCEVNDTTHLPKLK